MNESRTHLVLKRTSEEKGNKFAVRLDPTVNRQSDLYDLFRDGLVIEVLDIEQGENTDSPFTTLGISSSPEFKIDRTEKMCGPRTDDEIGSEEVVLYSAVSAEELASMRIEELDNKLTMLREAEISLRWQRKRLKEDKSLAHERGFRHPNNDHHHRWVMIIEEIDIVSEQLERVSSAIQQATAGKKARIVEINEAKRSAFQDRFIKIVRESLDSDEFERLRVLAEAA